MRFLTRIVGILILLDAFVHLYAGLFVENPNPQLMIVGGLTYLILSIFVFLEKRIFLYIATIIVGLGSLGTIFNYNSTGYPQFIVNSILGLDIIITIGLIIILITRKRSNKMNFIRERLLTMVAKGFVSPSRTPILKRPSDYGLAYEDVHFSTPDGVNLEGWFIPADSHKLVICNHFMGANRQGFPAHLKEWRKNTPGFEIDFLPRYKALHDAGYNVLAYDLRNHGQSAESNGGRLGMGILEARDVIGSLHYIRTREDTAHMDINLMSLCFGCVATFNAMNMHPEEFEGIKSFIAVQPLSADAFITSIGKRMRLKNPVDDFSQILNRYTGFRVSDVQMPKIAPAVNIPTMLVQVHDDFMTLPSDLEAIYANFGTDDKKLLWIENTDVRFEGYRYFENKPQEMIEWFDAHQ